MRSRGRVFGLSLSLFVCQFVCPPLNRDGSCEKTLYPAFKSDPAEAPKSLFFSHLDTKLNLAFSANDRFQFTKNIFSYDNLYRSVKFVNNKCTSLSSLDLQSCCGARKCVMSALAVWNFPVCVTVNASFLHYHQSVVLVHNSCVGVW